jgi:hypothetical protein
MVILNAIQRYSRSHGKESSFQLHHSVDAAGGDIQNVEAKRATFRKEIIPWLNR